MRPLPGYKIFHRYRDGGLEGADRSVAPAYRQYDGARDSAPASRRMGGGFLSADRIALPDRTYPEPEA